VPRIGAGIIVGYLPVFLIDEVWDLASRPWFPLGVIILMLGFTTLLYLYVEIRRRINDPQEAFVRTRGIFLLGMVESVGFGLIVTSLLGPFMVVRNWHHEVENEVPISVLREQLDPVVGQLPAMLGVEPFLVFPTAVVLMSFLAFFIGTFLQLLWEDLPITEPL
jgi:F0F1-type ATP synthase assembly protein I